MSVSDCDGTDDTVPHDVREKSLASASFLTLYNPAIVSFFAISFYGEDLVVEARFLLGSFRGRLIGAEISCLYAAVKVHRMMMKQGVARMNGSLYATNCGR